MTSRAATMRASGIMRGTGASNAGTARAEPVNAVTISADDYDKIRREAFAESLQSVNKADEAQKELQASRHAASMARAAKWPNTLAGLRARKTAARADAAEAKERAQQELDAIEENAKLQEKLSILRKANEYYSAQSDRMKALQVYRQRSFDSDVEKAQASLRVERQAAERAREAALAARIYEDVAAAAREEEERREAARTKAAAIVIDQKAQLRAVIARRMEELRTREEEGRAMLEATARMDAHASEAAIRKKVEAAAKNKEFQEENRRLIAARAALKASESEMIQWIDAQARAKQVQEAKIRDIIDRQRLEAQKKAKIISDIMAADYSSRSSTEEARLAKDVAEAEEREAREAADKSRKKAEMREAVLHHIEEVKRKTMERIMAQREEEMRDHEVFMGKLAALEAQEVADIEAKRARARQYQIIQRAQAADKKRNVEGTQVQDRMESVEADQMAAGGPLDAVFNEAVAKLRAEEHAKGHDTRPLDRLVHKLLNPPLIPNLQRV